MTEDSKKEISLAEAVKVVNAEIDRRTKAYERIASTDGQDLVMVDGSTIQGYNCQLMADPKVIAKVFLDYDYAACTVLDNEPSPDMWGELARKFGLDEVFGVDL